MGIVEKVYSLLEKMYDEIQGLKGEMREVKGGLQDVKEDERLDYVTLKVAKNEQDIMFLRYKQ